jgi:Leucine-rich repeat (LRR) protein
MNPSNKKSSSFQSGSFSASLPKEEEIKEDEWTKLDLANAKLVALSPNIALYTNITEIYLQNNCFTHLPSDFFSALIHLRVLDLSGMFPCRSLSFSTLLIL